MRVCDLEGLLRAHQFVGLPGQFQGLSCQLFFRQHALGDVMQDLGKASQLSGRVIHGQDDHLGPKCGAVLPNPLPLSLEAAVGDGFLQGPGGKAIGLLVRRIKEGNGFAQNFFRAVALDASRACVPARYPTLRVKHVNRIVLDAVEQQAQHLFIGPQRLFGLLAFADIPQDDGKNFLPSTSTWEMEASI